MRHECPVTYELINSNYATPSSNHEIGKLVGGNHFVTRGRSNGFVIAGYENEFVIFARAPIHYYGAIMGAPY
jgi:hypothetical protein